MASSTRTLKIIVDQVGNAGSGLAGIAGKLSPLKAAAGVATGGLAILGGATIGAGAKLVSLGSDAEEMQDMFDVVFSETGGQVASSLDEFGNAVGRNKFELMGFAAQFGDTFKPMGFAEAKAADLSVQMTQLATDLGSFKNMPAQEAFERLQGTLIGNHENALAFGVIINENTLKTELAAMGADNLTGAQLEQAKVQARINLLMKGTTDAQGNAAETSGSWANQMRGLKAELSESATAMGSELLPVLTPLLGDFLEFAKDVMPAAVEIFGKFAGDLQANVGPALTIINDAITRVAQSFGVNTEEVTAGDVVLTAFEAVIGTVVTALQLTAIAADVVSRAIAQGRRNFDSITGAARSFGSAVSGAMSSARSAISGVISSFSGLVSAARRAADSIPSWLRPGSPTPFEIGLRGISRAAADVSRDLPNAFSGVASGGLPGAAGGGGSAPVQVIVQYQPTISIADRLEVEQKLVPLLLSGLRKAGVPVGG